MGLSSAGALLITPALASLTSCHCARISSRYALLIVMLTGLRFSLQNQTRKPEVKPMKWRKMPEQMVVCESPRCTIQCIERVNKRAGARKITSGRGEQLRFSGSSSPMIAYFHRDFRSVSISSREAKTSFQVGKDNASSGLPEVPSYAFAVTLLSGFISF
jgi:hypothetical protein